jgi:pimeloyl-ACP methyl ester carboxylesterase
VSRETHPFHIHVQDGVRLCGERAGSGTPLVLLHGLTATRRYVLMGSRHLARNGFELVAFDARGHGLSTGAGDPARYEYADMVGDLERVLEGVEAPAVLAGNSMGAATATAFALAHPDRVGALVLVTPGYGGRRSEYELGDWERLAKGLGMGGVDGFIAAYEPPDDPRWRDTALQFTRQRLERHRHPEAVAAALRVVPRSHAFEMDDLARIDVPVLVVGSRDDADPGHPLELAEEYAERLPHAELIVEDEGKPPLAWQGARLSRAIEQFAGRVL